jgi:hypothetical protein
MGAVSMENFKETYRGLYAEIEKIHVAIRGFVKARNAATSANDTAGSARISGLINDQGSVLIEHVEAMYELLSQNFAGDATAVWRDYLEKLRKWTNQRSERMPPDVNAPCPHGVVETM